MAKLTTRKLTTTRRRATAAPAAAAPAAVAPAAVAAATVAVAPAEDPDMGGPADEPKVFVRKKDLVDRVVAVSGMKKKDVKPAVEATLTVLGQALSNGEALNINPLGKIQINRRKELENGEVLIARIRRNTKTPQA